MNKPAGSIFNIIPGSLTSVAKRQVQQPNEDIEEKFSHNIRDYMALVHKQRISEDYGGRKKERIKMLRKLLRKM